MRLVHFFLAFLLVFQLFAVAGCDEKTEKSAHVLLTSEESVWFAPHFSGSTYRIDHAIPLDLLSELDVLLGNTGFWSLYDESKNLLGYARQIADPLDCSSGKCKAIRFFVLFDVHLNYTAVFHPEGKSGDFYKGVEGDLEADELFTPADWEFLHSLLLDPPTLLLEAEDTGVIVDAVTTATYEAYWDVVVRQAAYTTYTVLHHMITSRELIQGQVAE